jgi:hypothetical protein
MNTLTVSQFKKRFRPQPNHLNDDASWEGFMYEPFGAELEYVKTVSPDRIWTVSKDLGNSGAFLVNGFKVGHKGYVICELPFDEDGLAVVAEGLSDARRVGHRIDEPCPFCGGLSSIEVVDFDESLDKSTLFCADCGEEFEFKCE